MNMHVSSPVSAPAELQRRLSIVIPAYNEREGLPVTLRTLCDALPEAEIIVVDDGSRDGTAEAVAAFPQVTCVSHTFNRGYGGALKTGMRMANREFVAWFDADNEHRVSDLVALVERIAAGNLVAVIAQRQQSGPSPLRNWGKWVIRMLARSFDVNVGRDINCGLRVFRRDVILRYLPVLPNGYSASITSTMAMLERGYPIGFVPASMNARIGHSKVKLGDGFMAIMLVLRMVMLFGPLRIFLSVGLGLLALGILYGLITALVQHNGIPAASVLVSLAGMLMALFGLIADQISQMRLAAYDVSSYQVQQLGSDLPPAEPEIASDGTYPVPVAMSSGR